MWDPIRLANRQFAYRDGSASPRLSRPALPARLRSRTAVTRGDGRSPGITGWGYALWHFRETGSGPPLVLLHGIGMSNAAWSAVTPYLESTRRVIAFDIAGFGSTPALPGGTPPTVPNLVDALDRSIRERRSRNPGRPRREFARRHHGARSGDARDRANRRSHLARLPLEEARRGPCSDRVPGPARHGRRTFRVC